MGIRRNVGEAFERIGNGTADFLDNVTDGVRQFACGLWGTYPKWITEGNSPGSSFARGYMNNICSLGGGTIPLAPTLPFTGGQCDKAYYIDAEYFNGDTRAGACDLEIEASTRHIIPQGYITGQVLSIGFGFNDNFQTNLLQVVYRHEVNGEWFTFQQPLGRIGTGSIVLLRTGSCRDQGGNRSSGYSVTTDLFSINVIPVDGIDDCGDLPTSYPDTPDPPASSFITNINITNEDGANWTIPLIYAPVDFNFPFTFDLGGVDVTLDIGGVDFNFGEGDTSTDIPPALPDGQPHPLPAPGDNAPKTPAPVEVVPPDGEVSCNHPVRPNLDDFDEVTTTDVESQDEETPETGEFKWILTVVTTDPEGNTEVVFDNPEDNVIYAGWFSWTIDVGGQAYRYPGIPIRKRRMAFEAPPNVTGYRVYTIFGARLSVSTYKVKQPST